MLAVDTKGEHLLAEASGRKLLNVRPHKDVTTRLLVRFVSRGKFTEKVEQIDRDGYTLWARREDGTLRTDHHPDMAAVVAALRS